MIIISEVVHNGEVHFQVNSCFVSMISTLCPNKKIFIRAENEHIITLQKNLKKEQFKNIAFLPFDKYYDAKKYNWGLRIIGECSQIIKTLRTGRKLKNKVYVWTCLFPTGHFFLNLLTYFQKSKKHIIILHGELEFLKSENKKITENIFGFILKSAMNLSTNKNEYIVLGDNVKTNLIGLVNKRVLQKTFTILHPYNYNYVGNFQKTKNAGKKTIGAIGTQMLSKNSQYMYQVAEHFKEDILEDKIVLRTIGKILPELDPFKTDYVDKIYSDNFVSQDQFECEISKLDFVIFFYDNNAYQLCASGAIFEAIRIGIPVISIENDFFKWLFNTYGDMGFLCKDLEEVKKLLNELKEGYYKKEIEVFKNNIMNFKIQNNLKNLALNLKPLI